MTTDDSYTMIRRFLDLEEANLAESVLMSVGVESYTADEQTIGLTGSHLGGARLYVRQSDAPAAAKLLSKSDAPIS
jgi:hypothetical protein